MKKLIGGSEAIRTVRERIDALARRRDNVLITGQPGTGKSIVAENIHLQSADKSKPYVLLNVPMTDELKLRTLAKTLLSKRRFVNPTTSGHGNFDLPDGTTLILDEVDRSSHAAQKSVTDLLRGVKDRRYEMRVIIILDGAIGDLANEGRLLDELVETVSGWETIEMPSLKERVNDIPELLEYFVREAAREMDLGQMIIDVNALSFLTRREWQGNVQELKTFVEQALILSEDRKTFVLPESLVDEQSELARMLERIDAGIDFALDRSLELIEKRILERVLKKFSNNQSKTAKFLGITEDTLRYRMRKLGISLARES